MKTSLKAKIAGVGICAALGTAGLAVAAAPASASTFNCVFSNGCGTISGADHNGTPVSVDSKYKNPLEEIIGYPDLSGDSATNYGIVAHSQASIGTHTWADTVLQSFHPVATYINDTVGVATFNTLSYAGTDTTPGVTLLTPGNADGCAISLSGNTLSASGTPTAVAPSIVRVSLTDSAGDVEIVYLTFAPASTTSCTGGDFALTASPYDTIQFNTPFNNNVNGDVFFPTNPAGGSVTEYNLPAGLTSGNPLLPGTAIPGTYNNIHGVATDAAGAKAHGTIDLKVTANHAYVPGPSTTFYTLVFAKNGYWSSDCITATASGKLIGQPCTLGHDPAQRFYAYTGADVLTTVNIGGGGTYAFKNGLTGNFLVDQSYANPATPQSDAADAITGTGRQLDANSPVPVPWTWGP